MKKKLNKASKKIKTAAPDSPEVRNESKKTPTDYDEFVKTWSNAGSVAEVASAMGIKRNSASAIAARLRKAGVVKLRSFPHRTARPIDVKRLNKIASGSSD